jgi:hypothetical protein
MLRHEIDTGIVELLEMEIRGILELLEMKTRGGHRYFRAS